MPEPGIGGVEALGGDLRLNLGCGSQRPAGWINVDSSPGIWLARHPALAGLLRRLLPSRLLPSADWSGDCVSADLTRRLPWPDGSAAAVYSSHLLEHLGPEEGARLLKECARLLRPGGRIRLVVPDLGRLVDDYVATRRSAPERAAARFHANSGYFDVPPPRGWAELLAFRVRSKNNHAFLYDEAALAAALAEAGFIEIERRDCGSSGISNIAEVDFPDRFEGSVCLEALKP